MGTEELETSGHLTPEEPTRTRKPGTDQNRRKSSEALGQPLANVRGFPFSDKKVSFWIIWKLYILGGEKTQIV
jgi:hypothetical protein